MAKVKLDLSTDFTANNFITKTDNHYNSRNLSDFEILLAWLIVELNVSDIIVPNEIKIIG